MVHLESVLSRARGFKIKLYKPVAQNSLSGETYPYCANILPQLIPLSNEGFPAYLVKKEKIQAKFMNGLAQYILVS